MVTARHSIVFDNGGTIYLPPNPTIIDLTQPDIFQNLAGQNYCLGTKYVEGDKVYYISRCKTTLAGTFGCEQPVASDALIADGGVVDGADAKACGTTPAVGDTTVYVLDTGTAANKPVNYYENGFINLCSATTSQRQSHRINRSTVGNTTGITVTLDRALRGATGQTTGALTVTTVDLYPDAHRHCEQPTLDSERTFLGYPMILATATYWFWVQTWGETQGHYVNTWPGATAGQRMVVFDPANQGGMLQWAQATAGNQIAGYLLSYTASGYGTCRYFMTVRR